MNRIELINDDRDSLEERIKRDITYFESLHGVAITEINLSRNYGSNYGGAQHDRISESDLVSVNLKIEL